jgi:hypothetical protein
MAAGGQPAAIPFSSYSCAGERLRVRHPIGLATAHASPCEVPLYGA